MANLDQTAVAILPALTWETGAAVCGGEFSDINRERGIGRFSGIGRTQWVEREQVLDIRQQ